MNAEAHKRKQDREADFVSFTGVGAPFHATTSGPRGPAAGRWRAGACSPRCKLPSLLVEKKFSREKKLQTGERRTRAFFNERAGVSEKTRRKSEGGMPCVAHLSP